MAYELVKLSQIDIYYCFCNFIYHHLVCLRVDINDFIQFFLYKIILTSQTSRKFGMLTRLRFSTPFQKNIFQFVLQRLIY
jgi:hypothetical protein